MGRYMAAAGWVELLKDQLPKGSDSQLAAMKASFRRPRISDGGYSGARAE